MHRCVRSRIRAYVFVVCALSRRVCYSVRKCESVRAYSKATDDYVLARTLCAALTHSAELSGQGSDT
eukprot:6203010-Pleurochrysis_carterae.AAC.2